MGLKLYIPTWVQHLAVVKRLKDHKLAVALVLVLWLFLYFSSVSKTYFYYMRRGEEIEISYIFLRAGFIWGISTLFAPLFFVLAYKFPLDTKRKKLHLLIHLLFSILFVPLHAILYRLAIVLWYPTMQWSWESFMSAVPTVMTWVIIISPLTYWLIIGSYYAKKYYDQYRKRELQNVRLKAELASIQLHVLKIQLHPHFLFNTLHNINSLIYEDPHLAGKVIDLLKKMLAKSIDFADTQEVKLREEVSFTQTYLDIEKIRFQDGLTIDVDIEGEALECYVPNLILQPLVENAIKHGVSRSSERGTIRISGRLVDRYLELRVEDNGPGLGTSVNNLKMGIGLKNNIERLNHLYKDYRFNIGSSATGGTRVEVGIPIKNEIAGV